MLRYKHIVMLPFKFPTTNHAAIWESGGIAPRILNGGTIWRYLASAHARLTHVKMTASIGKGDCVGTIVCVVVFVKIKFCPLVRDRTKFKIARPAPVLVTVKKTLFRIAKYLTAHSISASGLWDVINIRYWISREIPTL